MPVRAQFGPRWSGNWIGPARIIAHQRRNDGRLGRIVWCVHNTSLYRAAPKHIRPATTRKMFLYGSQALQTGQVLGGFWIDLLDHDGPLAEAVERPERNGLNEEGPSDQVPRKRTRVKSKTTDTESESDENLLISQTTTTDGNESFCIWRGKRLIKKSWLLESSEDDVFHASMDATAFANTALRLKTVEASHEKWQQNQGNTEFLLTSQKTGIATSA